ncbi:hypothetical protein VII00023_03238 [Vibrio ichthyoenteri ATCC 700023]|uniref:OmpA-like domain-containing protein n=1 Tax=Vibrio ichthyoenteri ATCC 700023 TaxID=870968 RepID=F9RYL2_9VIBR|nr:OmpA family protein [Vibrio ichthyoenteri]EGU46429.1 hypothetical protein VII00023_03238 [Vibrio ichthyoenteri ATCC 700023]
MKTQYLFTLLPCLLVAPFALAEEEQDEYEYIATPVVTQIADQTDDDRDGVINARDMCVDTGEGDLIDNDGCGFVIATEESLQLRILFANDSSNIEPIFENQIRNMADFLKRYPETAIEIKGFASQVGTTEYNLALSKRRAVAVEDELLSNGITADRLSIIGYGESNLEELGDDELSHAKNRKVTATVVGFEEEVEQEWTIFSVIEK